MSNKKEIGEDIYCNWSEESGGLIKKCEDGTFNLYEVTLYGVAIHYIDNYKTLEEAKEEAEKWT